MTVPTGTRKTEESWENRGLTLMTFVIRALGGFIVDAGIITALLALIALIMMGNMDASGGLGEMIALLLFVVIVIALPVGYFFGSIAALLTLIALLLVGNMKV
jgi:hypothetical protein